jgi:glycosyltransferase involved in cell wall biosynthesis
LVGPILPEFKSIISKFADERIIIKGLVPHSDLPAVYAGADVFVFPTINDGFGLVVLEAMASGLPVIVTTNCCATDVVVDGENGFVVGIRDPSAIRDRIEVLLEDPIKRRHLGTKARETVLANFTMEHYEKRLLKAYAE